MAGSIDVGSTFDAYEILALLARGGMANVWLARQRMKHGLETVVAIKTILPEFSLDPKFQTMFLDEARIACRIDHPNVARLLDVGEAQGSSYIVMEYVGGESLSRLRRTFARMNKTLPLAISLRVTADLCAGLHAAHELVGADGVALGVVHRDVSPQNVLLSDSGVVKLIDFGVAKARGRLGGETSAGFAKGKARYMAPEQASGLGLDRRADVFAAGAVLYELLASRTPIEGDNDMVVLKHLVSDTPIDPLPVSVPEPVRAVVEHALCKTPSDRYATAAAMRDAIEEAMAELGLRASAGDIERTLREQLADRIAERKQSVEAAMRAADVRAAGSSVPIVDESSTDLPRPSQPSDTAVAATTTQRTQQKRKLWPIASVLALVGAGIVVFVQTRHPASAPIAPTASVSASVASAPTSAVTSVASVVVSATTVASVTAPPTSPTHAAHKPASTAKPARSGRDWGGIE
jgi:serine/threonine-protein kinase